jgi:hypothetical protein
VRLPQHHSFAPGVYRAHIPFLSCRVEVSECVTGQIFDRPAGKLPGRFVVNSFIRFVSTLAPQLEATLDGSQPRFLTPLVATAQTVMSKDRQMTPGVSSPTIDKEGEEKLRNYQIYSGALDMEDPIEEPHTRDVSSILQAVVGATQENSSSVSSRMKNRKKVFNKLAASRASDPLFDLDKEYTFEFYQHLLLFNEQDDLQLEMSRPIGNVGLSQALNGQPLKFMSAHKKGGSEELEFLWSFDLWHSALYGYAHVASASDNK